MHRKTLTTPRYWLAKFNKTVFERRFPEAPWLSESAVYLLDSWLRPTDRGIEWGAGRSTVWLALRVKHLTSVESNAEWYERTKTVLYEKGIQNKVDLRLIPVNHQMNTDSPRDHPYAAVARELPDAHLDFALVDGRLRLLCIENVMSKIKLGGLLILDNSERFFPTRVLGQHTIQLEPRDQCLDERWERLWRRLSEWRSIITTNGVWDTRAWVKPLHDPQA